MPRRIPLALLALLVASCGNSADPRRDPRPTETAAPSGTAGPTLPAPPAARVIHDLVEVLPSCDLDYRGSLLDAGTAALVGRFGWGRGLPAGVTSVEHDGSTWSRISERKFQLSFSLLEPSPIFVAARAVGYGARSAAVALDDQPLGTLVFHREQIKIAQTGVTTLPVDAGLHTLTFRFFGRARDADAFADVDWIRVGVPDDAAATYGPPTLRDTIAPAAALAGVPHRSIALRAPGSVRCALRFPRTGRLRAAVGLQGTGEGEAELRVLRDGHKPELLRTVHLEGGEKAAWVDVDLSLEQFTGTVGAIELRATQAPRGGRVLFGDPAVVLPPVAAPSATPARAVIIVVLDGVARAELPPWSGVTTTLPALAELAQSGAVFDQHRAPSTAVSAVMASLITGLPPPAQGVTDAGARMPASLGTIAGIARDASVRTAMFTGVPYSFRAFGFASSWERFIEHAPSSGAAATAPIDEVAAWATETAKASADTRLLAVVHARGGHPPWDVTAKELSAALPSDYTGLVEPRTSAQKIARMRRAKHANVVTEADRQRIRSLETMALVSQDRALGALLAALKTANLWDATLLIVTGDVGSGAGELFADGLELKEPALTLPLYAHFPGGLAAGRRVGEPTEIVDLARTALVALGLPPPKQAFGRDLARLAADLEVASEGPQVATLDNRYAARWGDLVLSGKYPQPPAVCDLALDATCAFNRRDAMPIAASAMFRGVVAHELATLAVAVKREPATIDLDTAAALNVWGASE